MEHVYDDRMLPGYRFCPLEEELILHYLLPKANGMVVPGIDHVVFDFNLYGDQEPSAVWENFKTRRANDLRRNKDLYFITELTTKVPRGSRISRTVAKGVGTWKGDDKGKKICYPAGTHNVIGYRKRFHYENKGSEKDDRWIMLEFDLHQSLIHNQQEKKYVLCVLRKNEEFDKKRKQLAEEDDEMVGEDVDNKSARSLETQGKRQRLLPCVPELQYLQPRINMISSPPLATGLAHAREENQGQELLVTCFNNVPSFADNEPSALQWEEAWCQQQQKLQPCIDNNNIVPASVTLPDDFDQYVGDTGYTATTQADRHYPYVSETGFTSTTQAYVHPYVDASGFPVTTQAHDIHQYVDSTGLAASTQADHLHSYINGMGFSVSTQAHDLQQYVNSARFAATTQVDHLHSYVDGAGFDVTTQAHDLHQYVDGTRFAETTQTDHLYPYVDDTGFTATTTQADHLYPPSNNVLGGLGDLISDNFELDYMGGEDLWISADELLRSAPDHANL
ncbi:hypothetical protein C1H46_006357 [Malus baccata]|uniref:NAC domain-containing protein n=1 Tax=Malus baccata TaxID=106549 RepID=A0A540NBW7_MALBA|nr:hypothetical protein C1H46_006357 [Malus baccata]